MIDFKQLPEVEKDKIISEIKKKYTDANINVDDIKINQRDNNESLEFSYNGVSIKVPIGKPDQQTTNDIWKVVSGAIIALSSVFITLKFFQNNQANNSGKEEETK